MMNQRSAKKGQSTAEYAIVIALVLGAAIAMQTYVKRTIQDRVADAADQIPDVTFTDGNAAAVLRTGTAGYQYEPLYGSSVGDSNTNLTGNAALAGAGAGAASTVTYDAQTTANRTGTQQEAGAN